MHKAGSTLLEKILIDLCKKASIPVVNPHAVAWRSGISTNEIGVDLEQALRPVGYAYLGFRHTLPLDINLDLETPKKVLLVRDPRDMLTSLYYSHKYSHPFPKSHGSAHDIRLKNHVHALSTDIDTFAINNAHHYAHLFNDYKQQLLSLTNCKTYRYEDVIFDKEDWLIEMLYFFGLTKIISEKKLVTLARQIAKKNDIRPKTENPNKHIRQVTPGNFKKHLSSSTIDVLNSTLYPFLNYFNYI